MPVGKLMTPLGCTWCNFDRIRPTSAVKVANTRTLKKKKKKKNSNSHKSGDFPRRFRSDHLSYTLVTEQCSSRNRDIDSSRPCRDTRRNGHTYMAI